MEGEEKPLVKDSDTKRVRRFRSLQMKYRSRFAWDVSWMSLVGLGAMFGTGVVPTLFHAR